MESGVFIPIANGGQMMSETSAKYMPTFEPKSAICPRAEKYGFGVDKCNAGTD